MLVFLGLVFLALCVLGYLYLRKEKGGSGNATHAFELHKAWEGVNEVKCNRVIGPDVVKAARALTITATSWLNDLVSKQVIIDNHFEDFEILIKNLENCATVVPGFEEEQKRCSDFISLEMKRAYRAMVDHKKGVKS